jgi:hypothetical protein
MNGLENLGRSSIFRPERSAHYSKFQSLLGAKLSSFSVGILKVTIHQLCSQIVATTDFSKSTECLRKIRRDIVSYMIMLAMVSSHEHRLFTIQIYV